MAGKFPWIRTARMLFMWARLRSISAVHAVNSGLSALHEHCCLCCPKPVLFEIESEHDHLGLRSVYGSGIG